jgi:4-amino-4-deoxy-L-arabinose transferase-like glycosyltransferase
MNVQCPTDDTVVGSAPLSLTFDDPAIGEQWRPKPWMIVLLVVFAFALRVGFAAGVEGLNTPPEDGSDQQEFDTYAWNLAQGRGYRGMSPDVSDRDHLTAYRPPGPSLCWAALYAVFGHRYDVVRILHCAVGAAITCAILAIGWRCFNHKVAFLAAVGWAIHPISLLYSGSLWSESLAAGSLMLALLACLWFAERPTWLRATIAGVTLGAAVLVHPGRIVLFPLLALWLVWHLWTTPHALFRASMIGVAAIVTMTPWAVRNYLVFQEIIPFSTMGGSVLLQGNNRVVISDPSLYGYAAWDTSIPEYREALQAPNDEVERDRVAKQLAVEWIKNNVEHWPFLIQAKIRRGWTPFLQPHSPFIYRIGTLLSWGPILVLMLIGFVPSLLLLCRSQNPGWVIHLAILHILMLNVIFFGMSRYRYPVEPLCLLIAAYVIVQGWSWMANRRVARQFISS